MGYKHVAVGGTFDSFHKGHRELLKKAIECGESVTVGVTTDSFAGEGAESYEERRDNVASYLGLFKDIKTDIVELEDAYGPSVVDSSMDAIVVSEETFERAIEINRIRSERGLRRLEIIKIPMVAAEDGGPLSSTRIRRGEIDREGKGGG